MHRRTASRRIVTDGRVLGEIEQVRSTLKLAQQTEKWNPQVGEGSVGALERRLTELAEQAADDSILLVVDALPGEEFDELVRQHPPTSTQFEHYRERIKAADWLARVLEPPQLNPDTMGPELLAACLVEPEWSKSEVEAFWRALSKGEQNDLWNWIHDVQVKGANLPFFNAATGTTSGGGELLTMPVNGASPTADS